MAKWSTGLESAVEAELSAATTSKKLRISMRKFRKLLRDAGWIRSNYRGYPSDSQITIWTNPAKADCYLNTRSTETHVSFRYYPVRDSLDLGSRTVVLQPIIDKGCNGSSHNGTLASAEVALGGRIVIELPHKVVQLPRSPWVATGSLETTLGPDDMCCLESEVGGIVWPYLEDLLKVLRSCG